ncbi:MAG: hypothetical protein HOP19_11900 [Acidobacteria bacterium]|nr:hypothetical protein [Acidobacteriota bacterium]
MTRLLFVACLFITSAAAPFVYAQDAPSVVPAATPVPAVNPNRSPDDERVINALLLEVRLLRIALQTVNTNSKRIQLLAERIRLQQGRVDKVAADIDETREKLGVVATQLTRLAEIAKEFEIQIRQESVPVRRAEIDRQYRLSQLEVAPLRLRENQLKEREALLINLLNAENGKLYDLQEKMNALEREFEDEAAAERKANSPSRKR